MPNGIADPINDFLEGLRTIQQTDIGDGDREVRQSQEIIDQS